MSDKKVLIQGKVIDYGEMSDEKLLKLFAKMKEAELKLHEKVIRAENILKYYEEYN